jgi:signal transduction histidine kinase
MRLGEFILANREPILRQWESFAREIWPSPASADPTELRDHADAILLATVDDMKSDQTLDEQRDKSHGHDPGDSSHSAELNNASVHHGTSRMDSGFRLAEVLAEYRAMRASVVRLWRDSRPDPDVADLDDLTRFHESIDQSLARAVSSFTERVDQARRLFLAILGHDLRNPLNAMALSADMLRLPDRTPKEALDAASQITASAEAMRRMIGDLLDFAASGLGGIIPLSYKPVDLCVLCQEVVEEIRAAHRGRIFSYHAEGDLKGRWDPDRLRQVVSNLLGNAAQHAGDACSIQLSIRGAGEKVEMIVHNTGEPIPARLLPMIFDPLRRTAATDSPHRSGAGHIGLGLYIVNQVVTAHHGTIHVTSTTDTGTTFTLHLPRTPASPGNPPVPRHGTCCSC